MGTSVNPNNQRRASSRGAILRAAVESLAKHGYAQSRMTAIASAAGISRTALYKHFPTKADLLIALNDFLIRDWEEWMGELAESSTDVAEFLDSWIRDALSDSWRIPAAQVLTARDTREDLERAGRDTQDAIRSVKRILTRVLRSGVASGELRPDLDVLATAHALQSVVYALINSRSMDRPAPTVERRRDVQALADALLHGIRRSRVGVAPQATSAGSELDVPDGVARRGG